MTVAVGVGQTWRTLGGRYRSKAQRLEEIISLDDTGAKQLTSYSYY